MKFAKYQALGNDYLVVSPQEVGEDLSMETASRLCDRHYGAGSDGVLLGPFHSLTCDFRLRLYNPDGREFEKSGNGLRIFARYLWDCGLVRSDPFTVETPGGNVRCWVHPGGKLVTVEMGRVSFESREIPVHGPSRQVLNESLVIGDVEFHLCAATIGNPHCVVLCSEVSPELARLWGPRLETLLMFPNQTNVQFMQVLDEDNIRIEIWERAAGYTLASGSSSCAAAAAAHRLGLCGPQVTVHMPGGKLEVSLSEDLTATLKGPVAKVYEGVMFEEE